MTSSHACTSIALLLALSAGTTLSEAARPRKHHVVRKQVAKPRIQRRRFRPQRPKVQTNRLANSARTPTATTRAPKHWLATTISVGAAVAAVVAGVYAYDAAQVLATTPVPEPSFLEKVFGGPFYSPPSPVREQAAAQLVASSTVSFFSGVTSLLAALYAMDPGEAS